MTVYLAFLYDGYILMLFVYMLIILPVITFICALITKKKIYVEMQTKNPVSMKNQTFMMKLLFKNNSIFPASRIALVFTYWNQFSKDVRKEIYSISVGSNCMQNVACEIFSEYCGNIEFGIVNMRLYDLLGIWKFKIPVSHSVNVSILPDMPEIAELILKGGSDIFLEEEIYSTSRSGDDPSEIFRVREYAEGDKINRIHWKLSAKEGTLMVKDFGLPLDSSVVILLELYYADKDTESFIDAAIETAVSLSMQFIRLKQIHFIAWYDIYFEDLVRIRIENEDDIYEAISRIFTASAYKDIFQGIVTYQERYKTEQYSNLFYITSMLIKDEVYRIREFAKFANCHVSFITNKEDISEDIKRSIIESELSYSVIHPGTLLDDISKLAIMAYSL